MDERTEPERELEGVAGLIGETADEARAAAGWVRDELREALAAFGVGSDPGSDPDDA